MPDRHPLTAHRWSGWWALACLLGGAVVALAEARDAARRSGGEG